MNILDIYDQFKVPPWLQRHMLEVTAVGQYVVHHWQGPKLNKRALTEMLLLHDLGNIVKFQRPFFDVPEKDLPYWEGVQDEMIAKYGTRAQDATLGMLKTLKIRFDTIELLRQMAYAPDGSMLTKSWEAQIGHFADHCVTPKGIVGFEVRVKDMVARYAHRENLSPEAWYANAAQVQENVDVELGLLQNEDFSQTIEALKQTEI